jgi:hypothetical protein
MTSTQESLSTADDCMIPVTRSYLSTPKSDDCELKTRQFEYQREREVKQVVSEAG